MTRNPIKAIALAAAMMLPAAAFAEPQTARLTVEFHDLKSTTGAVRLAIYDSQAAYDGDGPPAKTLSIPADHAIVRGEIVGLPPGRYAIKAFHDLNGDGKLNTNPFGMPVEPYAFSNDARGSLGPATWADAAFDVAPSATAIRIAID